MSSFSADLLRKLGESLIDQTWSQDRHLKQIRRDMVKAALDLEDDVSYSLIRFAMIDPYGKLRNKLTNEGFQILEDSYHIKISWENHGEEEI